MRKLYEGLRDQILNNTPRANQSEPRIKFLSMWNGQVEKLKEKHPQQFDFRKPAVFIQLVPDTVDTQGGGVQIYDPFIIKIHIIHEFYNASNGTNELNLDVFDLADDVHSALQMFAVRGDDFGSSPLNRTSTELDDDHDNIYHFVHTYTTTWTDNSTRQPVGGFEIDPVLQADITAQKLVNPSQSIIANPTSLDFGNVTAGSHKDLSFTLEGSDLNNNVVISTSDIQLQLAFAAAFSTQLVMTPVDSAIPSTTINVRFSPLTTGPFAFDINYGTPGLNQSISVSGTGV